MISRSKSSSTVCAREWNKRILFLELIFRFSCLFRCVFSTLSLYLPGCLLRSRLLSVCPVSISKDPPKYLSMQCGGYLLNRRVAHTFSDALAKSSHESLLPLLETVLKGIYCSLPVLDTLTKMEKYKAEWLTCRIP